MLGCLATFDVTRFIHIPLGTVVGCSTSDISYWCCLTEICCCFTASEMEQMQNLPFAAQNMSLEEFDETCELRTHKEPGGRGAPFRHPLWENVCVSVSVQLCIAILCLFHTMFFSGEPNPEDSTFETGVGANSLLGYMCTHDGFPDGEKCELDT